MNGSGTEETRAATYESFYGLSRPPFTLAPDPRFLYLSASHDTVIRQVLRAIGRHEAFIVLSGEIGTGKTTICRAVVEQLDRAVLSCLVLNPFVSAEELLRQLLADFGVISRDAARSERFTRATKYELAVTLHDFLRSLAPVSGRALLLIDEAQHLSPEVLEELRVLAAAVTADTPLLQIVLVGQPGLLQMLAAADLRQLDQRISLRALVQPLEREDVEHYITHRLTVAGESVSVMFEPAAIARIHAISGGVPRVINLLCDRALAAGAERGVHEISRELVEKAAAELSFRRPPPVSSRRGHRAIRASIAGLAIVGALAVLSMTMPLHRLVAASLPGLPDAPVLVPPLPAIPWPEEALRPPSPPVLAPGDTPDDFVAPRPAK